jgi:hypothetical protein
MINAGPVITASIEGEFSCIFNAKLCKSQVILEKLKKLAVLQFCFRDRIYLATSVGRVSIN